MPSDSTLRHWWNSPELTCHLRLADTHVTCMCLPPTCVTLPGQLQIWVNGNRKWGIETTVQSEYGQTLWSWNEMPDLNIRKGWRTHCLKCLEAELAGWGGHPIPARTSDRGWNKKRDLMMIIWADYISKETECPKWAKKLEGKALGNGAVRRKMFVALLGLFQNWEWP